MECRYIYINNCLVANEIRRNGEYGFFSVNAGERHIKEKVLEIKYRLGVREGEKVPGNPLERIRRFSYYDMVVADSIFTLFYQGNSSFNVSQVLHTMSGNNKQTLTKEKRETIETSIQKLSKTYFEIDCTSHVNVLYDKEWMGAKTIYEGNFLPVEKKGNRYYGGREWMPLYRYASYVRQIISIPIKLLNFQSVDQIKLQDTDEVILIKRYLLQRLEIMRNRNNKKLSRTITYCRVSHESISYTGERREVGLMPEIGINKTDYTPDSYKNKKSKVHSIVIKILEYWIRVGYLVNKGENPPYRIKNGSKKSIEGIIICGEIVDPVYLFDEE